MNNLSNQIAMEELNFYNKQTLGTIKKHTHESADPFSVGSSQLRNQLWRMLKGVPVPCNFVENIHFGGRYTWKESSYLRRRMARFVRAYSVFEEEGIAFPINGRGYNSPRNEEWQELWRIVGDDRMSGERIARRVIKLMRWTGRHMADCMTAISLNKSVRKAALNIRISAEKGQYRVHLRGSFKTTRREKVLEEKIRRLTLPTYPSLRGIMLWMREGMLFGCRTNIYWEDELYLTLGHYITRPQRELRYS